MVCSNDVAGGAGLRGLNNVLDDRLLGSGRGGGNLSSGRLNGNDLGTHVLVLEDLLALHALVDHVELEALPDGVANTTPDGTHENDTFPEGLGLMTSLFLGHVWELVEPLLVRISFLLPVILFASSVLDICLVAISVAVPIAVAFVMWSSTLVVSPGTMMASMVMEVTNVRTLNVRISSILWLITMVSSVHWRSVVWLISVMAHVHWSGKVWLIIPISSLIWTLLTIIHWWIGFKLIIIHRWTLVFILVARVEGLVAQFLLHLLNRVGGVLGVIVLLDVIILLIKPLINDLHLEVIIVNN